MDKIGTSTPINKTAAVVTSHGFQYVPNKTVQTRDSDTPIATRPVTKQALVKPNFEDLTGRKFGRFTVIGLARESKGWVVRCQCGRYSVRRSKSVVNPANTQDRCEHCRHVAFLKKDEAWRRTGKDQDINNY